MFDFNINKKHKFIIFAFLMTLLVYFFAEKVFSSGFLLTLFFIIFVLVGNYIVNFPNATLLNTAVTSIILFALLLGYILVLNFFPNLSILIQRASSILLFGIFYLVLLINNIFLVVASREETIPLYRVASTWSKIIISTISIPLLAGVFKLSINSLGETLLVIVISSLFYFYVIWSMTYNPDVKKYKVGEITALILFGAFVVSAACISVSFIPTESFLRAIYVSSILIFGINYIEGHLRNIISKKLINESLVISFIFLVLLFIFHP